MPVESVNAGEVRRMNVSSRELQTLFSLGTLGGLSDGRLLERFAADRDEAAFEALLRRYGSTVWGICRRLLRDHHDAEDAFQTTFLVLARKGQSIAQRELVANWLYAVAYQTALKARSTRTRRRMREGQVRDMPEPGEVSLNRRDDLNQSLDRELSRLPDKYRIPIVLCVLQEKTHQEAAELLGWPIGTVSGRLSRAKSLLAQRLARTGVSLSAGSLTVLLARDAVSASVLPKLIGSTVQAASLYAAGQAVPVGIVSAEVTALTREVLKMMLLGKLKGMTIALLLIGATGLGLGLVLHPVRSLGVAKVSDGPGARIVTPTKAPNSLDLAGSGKLLEALDWALTGVDPDNRRVSALARWTFNSMTNDEFKKTSLQTGLHLSFRDLPVVEEAEILIDNKKGRLTDLKIGTQINLQIDKERGKITRITAKSQNAYFFLKAVDHMRRTISVGIGTTGLWTVEDLSLANDLNVLIGTKEGRLSDLLAGMRVSLELATENDRIVVRGIRAEN
jgi:RNA polymerase sigma factor (sigma-70 family)